MKRIFIVLGVLFLGLLTFRQAEAEIYSAISGKVIGEDTGKGVAGILVQAESAVSENLLYHTVTDDRGVYVLQNMKPGKYLLSFFKIGNIYLDEHDTLEVTLPKGKNLVNVNRVLKLGGSVSGTVLNADGVTPLVGITVSARVSEPQPSGMKKGKAELTDSGGKYILQGLPESSNCIVIVYIPGHAILSSVVKLSKGTITKDVNFIIKWDDITGISGYVRSSVDGKPINLSQVILRNSAGKDVGEALTNETGKYSIVGVPAGKYEATAFWPMGGDSVTKRDITIEAGRTSEVTFEFDKSVTVSWRLKAWLVAIRSLIISDAYAQGTVWPYFPSTPKPIVDDDSCASPSDRDAILRAYNLAKAIAFNDSRCIGPTLKTDLQNRLKQQNWIECANCNVCGKGEVGGNTMWICPKCFDVNSCGEVAETVLHELVHMAGRGEEAVARKCEWCAFGKLPAIDCGHLTFIDNDTLEKCRILNTCCN